jgi:hypothetical protein
MCLYLSLSAALHQHNSTVGVYRWIRRMICLLLYVRDLLGMIRIEYIRPYTPQVGLIGIVKSARKNAWNSEKHTFEKWNKFVWIGGENSTREGPSRFPCRSQDKVCHHGLLMVFMVVVGSRCVTVLVFPISFRSKRVPSFWRRIVFD